MHHKGRDQLRESVGSEDALSRGQLVDGAPGEAGHVLRSKLRGGQRGLGLEPRRAPGRSSLLAAVPGAHPCDVGPRPDHLTDRRAVEADLVSELARECLPVVLAILDSPPGVAQSPVTSCSGGVNSKRTSSTRS